MANSVKYLKSNTEQCDTTTLICYNFSIECYKLTPTITLYVRTYFHCQIMGSMKKAQLIGKTVCVTRDDVICYCHVHAYTSCRYIHIWHCV